MHKQDEHQFGKFMWKIGQETPKKTYLRNRRFTFVGIKLPIAARFQVEKLNE